MMITTLNPDPEFVPFPKVPRLFKDCVITEKIDGTNAQIWIKNWKMMVGIRNRWVTVEDDIFGFAHWAKEHEEELLKLGDGTHHGEWWGRGIQRGYGLTDRRFSLFNTTRWCLFGGIKKVIPSRNPHIVKHQEELPACCGLVPVLYRGPFDTDRVDSILSELEQQGSAAVPGFMNPEGVVVWHEASNSLFKTTIGNDGNKHGKPV